MALADFGTVPDRAIAALRNPRSGDALYGPQHIREEAIRLIEADTPLETLRPPAGNLFRVYLPDEHIARMLDWDALAADQPSQVQDALRGLWLDKGGSPSTRVPFSAHGGSTGQDQYNAIAVSYGGAAADRGLKQAGSEALGRVGIPGLKYWDQGSRAAGSGTRNYVVWQPEILRILGIE